MKDIQQRVSIVLEPLSRDICSHVITDKQWLQENVLCLLSNAVKYSSEGEVKVMLKLICEEEANPVRAKDNFLSLSFREKPPIFPSKKRAAAYQVFPVGENSLIADDSSGVLESAKEPGDQFPGSIDRMECGEKDPKSKIAKSFLLIEIEDNGIGLSEEAMSNLFNPFKQAQRLAGGTGLGLYSLARRVEALNGQYGVSNRRDGEQGCMFWFSIPYRPDRVSAGSIRKSIFPRRQDGLISSISAISEAEVKTNLENGEHASIHGEQTILLDGSALPPILVHNPAASTPTSASQRMITKTSQADLAVDSTCNNPDIHLDILVADDSPAIVKMTSMMLKRLGHRITCAENGDVALKKIWEKLESSKRPFDVVLMDLQMPVMDGLEATRRLRAFETAINSSSSDNSTVFPKRNLGLRKISIELDRSSFLTSSSEANPSSVGNSIKSQVLLRQLVIGVSANSDYETMQDALNAGVDAFMAKPFSIETFYDTYEKLKDNKV